MKLDIHNLSIALQANPILSDINATSEFQILGIIGPSGGGKSTLLKVIAGLLSPSEGEVRINARTIPFSDPKALLTYRRSLGIVFQSWNLFPHLTALENVVLPLSHVHGVSKPEAEARGRQLLDRFELLSSAAKRPHELSGGQCQRVAIIRAVASKPLLLLLDEPTSALDPLMTSEVLDLIVELKKEGIAFILVSHHMHFLQKIADQAVFLDQGRWIESSPVQELFLKPKKPQVIEYLSKALKY